MKKGLVLLVLPALLLSGCNKEISKDEAKDVAAKIAANTPELNAFQDVTMDVSYEESKTVGDKTEANSYEYKIEYSGTGQFAHEKGKEREGDKYSAGELWAYVESNVFYLLSEDDAGKKYGYKQEINPETFNFAKAIGEGNLFDFVKEMNVVLTTVSNGEAVNPSSYLKGENVSVETKYFTSGEGNLTVESTAKASDVELSILLIKGKVSGETKAKAAWDKNLPSMLEVNGSATLTTEAGGNYAFSEKAAAKFSFDKITFTHPDPAAYIQ